MPPAASAAHAPTAGRTLAAIWLCLSTFLCFAVFARTPTGVTDCGSSLTTRAHAATTTEPVASAAEAIAAPSWARLRDSWATRLATLDEVLATLDWEDSAYDASAHEAAILHQLVRRPDMEAASSLNEALAVLDAFRTRR